MLIKIIIDSLQILKQINFADFKNSYSSDSIQWTIRYSMKIKFLIFTLAEKAYQFVFDSNLAKNG